MSVLRKLGWVLWVPCCIYAFLGIFVAAAMTSATPPASETQMRWFLVTYVPSVIYAAVWEQFA